MRTTAGPRGSLGFKLPPPGLCNCPSEPWQYPRISQAVCNLPVQNREQIRGHFTGFPTAMIGHGMCLWNTILDVDPSNVGRFTTIVLVPAFPLPPPRLVRLPLPSTAFVFCISSSRSYVVVSIFYVALMGH
jgi:hypothetical protein